MEIQFLALLLLSLLKVSKDDSQKLSSYKHTSETDRSDKNQVIYIYHIREIVECDEHIHHKKQWSYFTVVISPQEHIRVATFSNCCVISIIHALVIWQALLYLLGCCERNQHTDKALV